jgi:hypothetical protein
MDITGIVCVVSNVIKTWLIGFGDGSVVLIFLFHPKYLVFVSNVQE